MRKRTEVITYNLNERGRSFNGVDRDVDIAAAMSLINGPALQELIRSGDVFGYFGHQYRQKYGLVVPEVVTEDGKQVVLEPCVRTVMIKCLPDGTVQHVQEFLDNAPGRIAGRLYDSKAYGFSSVFHAPDEGGKRTPKSYHGMDFVKMPNYNTNRGYDAMLDSLDAGGISATGFAEAHAAMMDSVDQMMAANEQHAAEISDSYLYQCQVNDELIELNARLSARLRALEPKAAMLDSIDPLKLERASEFVPSRAAMMLDSAERFDRAILPDLDPTPEDDAEAKRTGFVAKSMDMVRSVIRAV